MPIGPGVVIDAPRRTPPPNGLLVAADVIDRTDDEWTHGISYQADACGNAEVFDPCTWGTSTGAGNRPTAQSLLPFVLETHDKCSTFGGVNAGEYEARARRSMEAQQSKAVEREFLLAEKMTTNVHLQDDTNTTKLLSSAAQGLRTSLAVLVQAIADNNLGIGMIHARPSLVTQWSSQGLLFREGKKIYTINGNLVVPGSGYTGASPAGVAATPSAEWAYVTDVLQVYRGPIEVFAPESDRAATVNRTDNTVTVRAQRVYAVAGSFCTIAAVKVDTTSIS